MSEEKWVEVRKARVVKLIDENEKMIKKAIQKRNMRIITEILSSQLENQNEEKFQKLLGIVIEAWKERYFLEWTSISNLYHDIETEYGLERGLCLERILRKIDERNAKYVLVSVRLRRMLYDKCTKELGEDSDNQIRHHYFLEHMEAKVMSYL